jgi:toxin-antitoxin system PIN domain toxin
MTLLLDVNVLIALFWSDHAAHDSAQEWFARKARTGWATCPFTQAGFVRIISNPSFSSHAVTPQEATRLLVANLNHPGHRFWKDELTLAEGLHRFQSKLKGHQQVGDAYLLGLAVHQRGKLATFDKKIGDLLSKSTDWGYLEVIGQ